MCAGKRACWRRWASASILRECAATGATDDLVYVSPKSGRAVSRDGGGIYAATAVRAAGFLLGSQAAEPMRDEIAAAWP